MDLGGNFLEGTLPDDIFTVDTRQYLGLCRNNFTGTNLPDCSGPSASPTPNVVAANVKQGQEGGSGTNNTAAYIGGFGVFGALVVIIALVIVRRNKNAARNRVGPMPKLTPVLPARAFYSGTDEEEAPSRRY